MIRSIAQQRNAERNPTPTLEDLVYSHTHRHIYEGPDTLFGLDTSQIESGVFDLDRIPVMDDAHIPDVETLSYTDPFASAQIPTPPLKSKILSEVFTAGAGTTTGQVVAITGDNTVSPADNTLRSQCVGVALNDALIGEEVEVLIYGKISVVADGAITVGNPVASAPTAGRVISLLSHSHTNPDTSNVDLAHTHTNPNTSIIGNHSHTNPNTSSVDLAHTHSNPNTSTTGSHTHSNPSTSSVNLAHTHSFTPSGSIGTTSINHRHSYTPAGSISSVSAGTPSGSIGSTSINHRHLITITTFGVSAGTPSGRIGNHNSSTVHGHIATTLESLYAAAVSGGSPTHVFHAATNTLRAYYLHGDHNHTFTGDALATHYHGINAFSGYTDPSHSHTFTGSALATHNHSFTGSARNTSYTNPSHNHTFTGSAGITGSSLGSHSHTQGSTGSAGSHSHTQGATGSSLGPHSHTQGDTGLSGSHFHTQNPTGSALGVHSHTQDDTGVVNNAQIVGKALTSGNLDDEIEILVCLAG